MSETSDVVIVGGGITGCAIAQALATEGVRAVVLEQGQIGGAATTAAAGVLTTLADAPEPTPFFTLALAGFSMFQQLAGELREASGIDIGYSPTGTIRLAFDETEALLLRQRQGWQEALGYHLDWLATPAVRELEPAAAETILGGLHSPEEGSVDAARLVQAYARAATRAGADIREGVLVEGLVREGNRLTGLQLHDGRISFDRVIFAAGAWSARWTAAFGVPIPVYPVRGQVLSLKGPPAGLRKVLYLGKNYLVPKPDGTIIVGATQEPEAGFEAANTLAGIAYLATAARQMAPGLGNAAIQRIGVGLRPGSPDGWPILGPLADHPEVILATGHFRNGILLSAITGRIIADLICHGDSEFDLEPFRPERFLKEPVA